MATKAQIKKYFETGKIPTQAQFGELIDWAESVGSEFPRTAYITSQSAWNTWLTKFKAAHPEAGNGGGSASPILNEWVIDSYTFIVKTTENINFAPDDTYEFINCSFVSSSGGGGNSISMNFYGCVFRNCYLNINYRITSGEFYGCVCVFNATANNVMCRDCNIDGGALESCDVRQCDVQNTSIKGGTYSDCNLYVSYIEDSASILGGSIFGVTLRSVTIRSAWINLFDCKTTSGTSLKADDDKLIQGFIHGCDFSSITSTDWAMKGAQCCKFKSTLLSTGKISADIFGNRNAATNGMNTGI